MAIDLKNPTPELLEALEKLVTVDIEDKKRIQRQNLIDERDAKIRTETNRVTDEIMAEYQILINAI